MEQLWFWKFLWRSGNVWHVRPFQLRSNPLPWSYLTVYDGGRRSMALLYKHCSQCRHSLSLEPFQRTGLTPTTLPWLYFHHFYQLCFQASKKISIFKVPHSLALFQFLSFFSHKSSTTVLSVKSFQLCLNLLFSRSCILLVSSVLHMYLNKYIFFHWQDHFVINPGAKC